MKNGWNVDGYKSAQLNNCQYTDIKLNILLVSKHNISIVAEVQFLLNIISAFKVSAHSLYSIERMHEFVDNAKKLLPFMLEDKANKLFRIISTDDKKSFVKYLVVSNLSIEQILMYQNERKSFTLNIVARYNSLRIFDFITKQCIKKGIQCLKYLLQKGRNGDTPLLTACICGNVEIVGQLLTYETDDYQMLWSKNDEGSTPLIYCTSMVWNEGGGTHGGIYGARKIRQEYAQCIRILLTKFSNRKLAKKYVEYNPDNNNLYHLVESKWQSEFLYTGCCFLNYLENKICNGGCGGFCFRGEIIEITDNEYDMFREKYRNIFPNGNDRVNFILMKENNNNVQKVKKIIKKITACACV
eukprot:233755_1